MKVLHAIAGLDPRDGGPVAALRGLTAALSRHGARVHVVATYTNGADLHLAKELEAVGVDVESVGPVRTPLGYHRSLRPTLARLTSECDVLHIHGLWEQIQHVAARCAAARHVPYVFRPCGMLDPWSLRQSRWKKKLYLRWRLRRDLCRAAAIHFTTEQERRLTESLRLPPRAIVEPNGIDFTQYQNLPEPGAFRARHLQNSERPLLLFLSRLHPKKGLDLLLPALSRLKSSGEPMPTLVLAGPCSESYRRELDGIIARHGLEACVHFTGMLNEAEKLEALVDADLFVLPSYQENFGIAVMEALASGTPVIVSDRVNLCHVVADHGVGDVVAPNVEAVAAALTRWLRDAQRRADAGRRGRELARAHYDWPGIAERWIEHYDEIVQACTNRNAT